MDETFKPKTNETLERKEKDALIAELKQQKYEISKKDALGFYNRTIKKAGDLKIKYPGENYEDYEMWHVMIGSTMGPMEKFDFPEKEIEEFIRSEYRNSQV